MLCCRYDLVEDLTSYLYNNNLLKYIEGYVQKVSPQKTPMVSWGPRCYLRSAVALDGCLGAGISNHLRDPSCYVLLWATQLRLTPMR